MPGTVSLKRYDRPPSRSGDAKPRGPVATVTSCRPLPSNFQRKVAAGADSAITQYFFNADAYWSFVEACVGRGIAIPIVPGIMPISSYTKLARFSDACGAEIPRWIRRKLESYGDDVGSIRAFGLDVVSRLCEELLEAGAPGIHFYTLNRSPATRAIFESLRTEGLVG